MFSYNENTHDRKVESKNDLIILGTPPGWQNNYLNAGDDVSQIIDGIGELNYKII